MSATEVIRIDAGGWGLSWAADEEGRLHQLGLGVEGHDVSVDVAPRWYPSTFPTLDGTDPFRPPPLQITHADGTLSTRLALRAVERDTIDGGEHVVVRTGDELTGLAVEHHARTHSASGVLEQWVEVHHDESGPVTLLAYDSIAPFLLVADDAEVCHFGGSGWADEWRWSTDPLVIGTTVLGNLGGIQPHLQRSPCLLVSPDGPSSDDAGTVIGLSVCWGGNAHFSLDVRPTAEPAAPRELRLRAGANPLGAPYRLEPGVRFVTPSVAWTWSTAGRDRVTASFHDWARARILRDPDERRMIVANNWEATFFDFDEARITGLIDGAADIGAEVFLLDDGWFGTELPRDDDTQGLGDWEPDERKLPGGLGPLVDAATDAGIRFGIWVEPEMVNPRSVLHRTHPEWVVRDRRDPREHRNQLLLDPLRAQVRDFEVDVVTQTLARAPGTSYVKWDANRPVTDPGSATLPADRQANLWVDLVHATWDVMARATAAHPDVEMMLCASGGGRVDFGTLRWFHEFWTSDNTDPVARVRMQWACSHFFPASTMAAHVTRWGGRPLDFASAVALSGRFGLDVDLDALTDAEREVLRRAVTVARRTQDVVQSGSVHRYVSPVEGPDRSRAAWSVGGIGGRTILFAYQLEHSSTPPPLLVLRGLRAGAACRVTTFDLTGDGCDVVETLDVAQLAEGLPWPLSEPLTARVWEIAELDAGDDR
ncbi:MAG: alpha-galactosidase [Actinobacteria bacterium]|nr:alpha-galactosidase [Actinomycetota bacterium]